MEGYLYETHSHTSEASACGKVSGSDYTEFMKKRGFQGMIITDHFLNGNTAIDKRRPWKEQVAGYVSGYKKALEAAKGKDFDGTFNLDSADDAIHSDGDVNITGGVSASMQAMTAFTQRQL